MGDSAMQLFLCLRIKLQTTLQAVETAVGRRREGRGTRRGACSVGTFWGPILSLSGSGGSSVDFSLDEWVVNGVGGEHFDVVLVFCCGRMLRLGTLVDRYRLD